MLKFIDVVPLDPAMEHTPLDKAAPLAPVRLVREGGVWYWEVIRCPYCGKKHRHGGEDWIESRRWLGCRIAHCMPRDYDEYRLVAVEGDPTRHELDEHFPMMPPPVYFIAVNDPDRLSRRTRGRLRHEENE